MFKKTVAALMLAGLASGQAFAAGVDFENASTSSWSTFNGTMTLGTYGTTEIFVSDDLVGPAPFTSEVVSKAGLADDLGTHFGVLTAGPVPATSSSTPLSSFGFTASLTNGAVVNGGTLYIKMFTADDAYAHKGYNDSFTVYADGVSIGTYDALAMMADNNPGVTDPDAQLAYGISPWVSFSVAAGTQQLALTFNNMYDGAASNAPQFAIDFAAAPVPEADSVAMMMAGLGVLGMVARRRRAGKAA